ncbi:MAG: hypothetical protein UH239_07230 [Acutalibacteraceae bacterium]|nr:hypothetical protein [Acutalibacteraceae bacterium]
MKKINKNIFVFIASFAFILLGFFSLGYIKSIYYNMLVPNEDGSSKIKNIVEFKVSIEKISTEQLSYHGWCLDINSIFNNLLNKKIIEKDDQTVVKMDNGYLAEEVTKISDKELKQYAENVAKLDDSTDAPFLYVMAPKKGNFENMPENADNYLKDNCDKFIDYLSELNVNTLDLRDKMYEQGITEEEAFFVTDHHWKPTTGFWTFNEICKKLNSDYGFNYNHKVTDISNYTINTYDNCFLGSYGKKVGRFFTNKGMDDFDLIVPDFETNLKVTNEKNGKLEVTEGDFENSVLCTEYLEYKDCYDQWMYATYSGGDFSLQIVENKIESQYNKKVLILRDSFACTVTPFLSLTTGSLHIVDLRESVTNSERIPSVSKYIDEIQPDYVIVMYSGIRSAESYAFN